MIRNEGSFLAENEFDVVPSNGRYNVHNDTQQKFSMCFNLGHIPVNKVNSTVNNRRVSVFGDQSVVTHDEIGMTRNVFHGFYSKFNLPPDVDPETLSLIVSGEHSVTVSGTRQNLKISKTTNSKNSLFLPKGKIIRTNKPIQMNIPENINKQSSYPYIRNAPEPEAISLTPDLSTADVLELTNNVPSTEDAEDDFPPPPPELLDSSLVKNIDSNNEQNPVSSQNKALVRFLEKNNEGTSVKAPKFVSNKDAAGRKPLKFFRRSRKSKREMHSVETQTTEPVQIPQELQCADVKESKRDDFMFTDLNHETQNLADFSSKDKQGLMETETPNKQNFKLPNSDNEEYLSEFQAQDKPEDIKTNAQNWQDSEKILHEDKHHIAVPYPQVGPVHPSQTGQGLLETHLKDFTEIDLQNENVNLDIHPSNQQHVPKCYLQGREIPQEIPLDMWVDYLKCEYQL